ncbi:hypothetical protein [uncultured Sphingomonas sp.]|uniref:hypothetical protein n=1 Tax=uncultured Sphingomonas sp. TaxID=158754 RepID=UPI003747BD11
MSDGWFVELCIRYVLPAAFVFGAGYFPVLLVRGLRERKLMFGGDVVSARGEPIFFMFYFGLLLLCWLISTMIVCYALYFYLQG